MGARRWSTHYLLACRAAGVQQRCIDARLSSAATPSWVRAAFCSDV